MEMKRVCYYQNGRYRFPEWWPSTVAYDPEKPLISFTSLRRSVISGFLEELLREGPLKYGEIGGQAWIGEILNRLRLRKGSIDFLTGHDIMHWLLATKLVSNFQQVCEAAAAAGKSCEVSDVKMPVAEAIPQKPDDSVQQLEEVRPNFGNEVVGSSGNAFQLQAMEFDIDECLADIEVYVPNRQLPVEPMKVDPTVTEPVDVTSPQPSDDGKIYFEVPPCSTPTLHSYEVATRKLTTLNQITVVAMVHDEQGAVGTGVLQNVPRISMEEALQLSWNGSGNVEA